MSASNGAQLTSTSHPKKKNKLCNDVEDDRRLVSEAALCCSRCCTQNMKQSWGMTVHASSVNDPSKNRPTISTRGQRIQPLHQHHDQSAIIQTAAADAFHPTENRDGYLNMIVAENKLMWRELAKKLTSISSYIQGSKPQRQLLPQWIFGYGDMGGQLQFKQYVARVIQRWIKARPIDPCNVRLRAGAGCILSHLSYILASNIPAPNYTAYASDFGLYGQLQLYVVPTQSCNDYVPTIADLGKSFCRAMEAGHPPKIFLICQPNNPTGLLYSPKAMRLMIQWALTKGLHVVSDEIYALSVFPGCATTSAADIMNELSTDASCKNYLGDHVHIVAGLSKDWGMNGFRVGTLFTHNQQVLKAFDTVGYYSAVSQYTQHVLTRVFEDEQWMDDYIQENQKRLHKTFVALREALGRIRIPLVASHGAFFGWADFSSCLKEGQSERDLWLELVRDAKVLFTMGESCNAQKPGMFRLVYTWPEGGPEAMQELGNRLVKWKEERDLECQANSNDSRCSIQQSLGLSSTQCCIAMTNL